MPGAHFWTLNPSVNVVNDPSTAVQMQSIQKKNISHEILFWRCFIIIIMKLFVSKCKPERCWILLSIYRYRNPLKVKANRQTKLLLVYVIVLESILVFTFRFCGLYHVHWRIFVFAREIWYTCVSYPIVSIILAAEFEI